MGTSGICHFFRDIAGCRCVFWHHFCRYIPVGILEQLPQKINAKPPYYFGRNDLETLMGSPNCADWIKLRFVIV